MHRTAGAPHGWRTARLAHRTATARARLRPRTARPLPPTALAPGGELMS